MFSLHIIHTYSNGLKIPKWLIVKPVNGCFDWSCETIYIALDQTFNIITQEEINDDVLGLSILSTELVTNSEFPNHIGVYIPWVKERIHKIRGEEFSPRFVLSDIEHLVIQMTDIEISTMMNFRSLIEWD